MTWSRMILAAVLVVGLTVGAAGVLRLTDAAGPRRQPAEPGPSADGVLRNDTLSVLHAWDRRRSRAWADGDVRALRGLYTASSMAGVRDCAMLRLWRDRGLVVRHLTMQVLDVRVRGRTAGRVVLVVTDRLTGAVAVGSGVRRDLPADRASTHTVALRRIAGEWRVSSVRDETLRRDRSAAPHAR
jgi:hypothetical protein